MRLIRKLAGAAIALAVLNIEGAIAQAAEAHGPELRVLFLGDNGHHRPADRFKELQPVMEERNIELTYTDSLDDLNEAKLTGYDCVLIFANHTRIEPEQEKALLDFVAAGGGFVPLHCASFCFLNSPKYIELVGGQFKSHGTGVFKDTIVKRDHPAMQGISEIESWDETYVHDKHNSDRTVLAERRDDKGSEPYTWVRKHGKGRVFYTAWGHDQRTWSNAGFQKLVENGIRWSSENSPVQLKVKTGLKPFEYMEAPAPLPNYVANARWGTQADPIRTMQKPLEPEESMKHLALFPDFEVKLVAAEPDIVKPIWLSWDEKGRLWIAETVDYPNDMQAPGQGNDRLTICEDTNGDGKADKFTVFAEKLSVPTSFVFANGGVIVVHSGKAEFFKDTNGDDKADETKVLFTGWGTQDTHAGPSNLRYGFDNWIWGTVGYSGFRGTVGGKEIRFGQGIFRFKPDGSQLEFVRSSNNNTWGLGLTEDNIIIGSTANGNASMYMPIPNRYYEGVEGWSASRLESIADSQRFFPLTEKVRQVDWHDKYTAGAGSAIYTARSFPKEYWNRVQFVAEPTGHLLGKFHLHRIGSDFAAYNGRNFLASDDEWSSPIAAEVGPDGALWVIDWYNYIIQHNPTPNGFQTGRGNAYATPLRDKTHGRIYRVAYAKGTPSKSFKLTSRDNKALLEALESETMLWRQHAQRLIVDAQNKEIIPGLCELAGRQEVDEIGLNPAAIHALWALEGLGAFRDGDRRAVGAAVGALKHRSAGVRRAAVMVLPRNADALKEVLAAGLLKDSDAQVRMAAMLALSEMPFSAEAGEAVFATLNSSEKGDRWIPDAATAAAARHDAAFLQAVLTSYKPAPASAAPVSKENLLPNAAFEEEQNGRPAGWRTVNYSGRAQLSLADFGRSGKRSVKITSEQGADASWTVQAPVKPRTDYQLSAWIKTENVQKAGGAHGAMLNIHELQDPVKGGTKALAGDNDWTHVQLTFNSGEMRQVTINCLFGGWGRARGTAYYDDIELRLAGGSELAGDVGRVVRLVTGHYAQRGPVDTIVPTLAALKGTPETLAIPVLDGFVSGWPNEKAPKLSAAEAEQLKELMKELPEPARDRLLALSQKWGRTDIFGESIGAIIAGLREEILNPNAPSEKRVAAAKRLLALEEGLDGVELVLKQINVLAEPTLATGFITAINESRNRDAGEKLVASIASMTPGMRRAAVATLLRKPAWTMALLEAVDKNQISSKDISAEHWTQLRQSPNRAIAGRAGRLSRSAGNVSADREEVVKKLLPLAKESGSPTHGKEVYANICAVCHTFNGQGGKVGPDLSGIGAKDRTEILLDILDPNRSVESNYQLWNVSTKDGETFSGRLETETQTTVEILDTTGNKHVIQRKEIATMQGTPVSIMPSGFEEMPAEDLTALLAYLTEKH